MNAPFTTEIPVRYADIDSYGHVNNATYATYLEEARIDYLETLLGAEELGAAVDDGRDDGAAGGTGADAVDSSETGETHGSGTEAADSSGTEAAVGIVVANLEIDFERPIQTADAVTVEVRLAEVGTSSFTLAYRIRSPEGVHADAETTMVAFDRAQRTSRPIPDEWRQAIDGFDGDSAA